jgi:hypothetical protein
MKKVFQFRTVAFMAIALFISSIACAQGDMKMAPAKKAPASPLDSASGMIGKAMVSIKYSSPSVRGRKIFGGLQPWDKMWRAGANPATIIKTDKDIKVEGKTLPAGKYSLFVTPSEKGDWTVTINSETGQWGIKNTGEANEDPAKDVVVVKVKPKTAPLTERLVYAVTSKGFSLTWETTEIFVAAK